MTPIDDNDKFELKAMAFKRMTGVMAPGKNEASADYQFPYEGRIKLYELWDKIYRECTNAMITAFQEYYSEIFGEE